MIPPQLAYGQNGLGDMVPPNATLIFKIKALKVVSNRRTAAVDPFGQEQEEDMPDFDKHTPGFQKAWKEQ
mgnify:CR=1 FL=1